MGNQQRDEVAFCSATLFEELLQLITDQRRSGNGQLGKYVLLHGCAPISQALPKLVIDGGGSDAHEAIVAAPGLAVETQDQSWTRRDGEAVPRKFWQALG